MTEPPLPDPLPELPVEPAPVAPDAPAPISVQAPGFPTWKQSIILIVSGTVLALTSCFGFLIAASSYPSLVRDDTTTGIVMIFVILCILGAVIGVLMLFWLVGRALLGRPTR